jgi:hypothetical protein
MTCQQSDILIHRGERLSLCATPLETYFENRSKARPTFICPSSCLWRGYVATWEIRDQMLYLVGIEGEIGDGPCAQENLRPATLADVMGVRPEPILADWVHGELRCPEGKLLQFTRHAFGGIYERDRLFRFSSGCLNEEMLRLNPPDPIWYRLDATGGRERVDDWREVDVVLDDPFKPDEIPQGHVFWGRPDPSVAPLVEGYTIPGCTIFGRPYNQDG